MRIGIFGGSFNPPHIGHLDIAERAYRMLRLNKLIIVPAGCPRFENEDILAGIEDRCRMCHVFKESLPNVSVFNSGAEEGEKYFIPYAVSVLKEKYKDYPDDEYFLILGGDVFADVKTWDNAEYLVDNVTFCVCERDNDSANFVSYLTDKSNLQQQCRKEVNAVFIPGCCVDDAVLNDDLIKESKLSSTEIRRKIKAGKKFAHLVPSSVAEYIKKNGMYGYQTKE